MTTDRGDVWRDTRELEHRGDRDYDAQDASHLIMPDGTLVASFHRGFLGAAGRHVLAAHLEAVGR